MRRYLRLRVAPLGVRRCSLLILSAVASGAVLVAGPSPLLATPPIIRMEEDWELRIREPDVSAVAPQVTCVMSPFLDAHNVHAAFELNHRTQPAYAAGGMQLQVWNRESLVIHRHD